MLTPCTISWLFGKWKRTEGFTTSSIFTGKDKSECDINCEWLWSHLYLHCCSCASGMLCFAYMHFAHTRDREWHQWKCIFSLLHLCTFVYCVPNKMSHHFISWVHFIIHSSGIHTLRVYCTLNAWMLSTLESNRAWAYFTRSWHRSDGGVSQEACHWLMAGTVTWEKWSQIASSSTPWINASRAI